MRPAAALLLCLLLLCAPRAAAATPPASVPQTDVGGAQFVNVALPASGEVRVENLRGGVRVEVWGEDQLALAVLSEAAPATTGPPRARQPRKGKTKAVAPRSPVQLDRTNETLSITVARGASGKAATARVDLILRVPARARLRVSTAEGGVEVRGVPALLAAQTISGDMRLSVPADAGGELTAQSLNGEVVLGEGFDVPDETQRVIRKKLRVQLGGGAGSVVNLFSGRGRITLDSSPAAPSPALLAGRDVTGDAAGRVEESAATAGREGRAAEGERRAPVLAGRTGPRPTATPQPAETPQEIEEDEVVRVEADLVTVSVSVVDRASGRGVTGLVGDDFKLYEDDAEQRVEHFEAANAPFDLMLLIDLSGSTARVTSLIRAAAQRFIAAARPQDRISIVTFAGSTEVVAPLTTNRALLREAVSRMQPPQGDTRLYDALDAALRQLERDAGGSRRRAVVLMSDGLDSTMPNVTGTGSTLSYEEVRRRVEEFDGILYSIWTSTEYEAFSPFDIQPETFDLAHDRMKELSEAGGGVFYLVERLEDLAGAYERVIADLGTVYSLSYRPTNRARDGSWRSIRVRLPRHADAVARGKRGYYAK